MGLLIKSEEVVTAPANRVDDVLGVVRIKRRSKPLIQWIGPITT